MVARTYTRAAIDSHTYYVTCSRLDGTFGRQVALIPLKAVRFIDRYNTPVGGRLLRLIWQGVCSLLSPTVCRVALDVIAVSFFCAQTKVRFPQQRLVPDCRRLVNVVQTP